jgi:hypothetical protein
VGVVLLAHLGRRQVQPAERAELIVGEGGHATLDAHEVASLIRVVDGHVRERHPLRVDQLEAAGGRGGLGNVGGHLQGHQTVRAFEPRQRRQRAVDDQLQVIELAGRGTVLGRGGVEHADSVPYVGFS